MEETATSGCGGLLQPVRRSDCHLARRCHGNCRVAVGTRRSKTERHPSDAPGDGMRVQCPDLYGVVHTHENQARTRRPSRIPLANRSCCRSHRFIDGAPWRVPQWREWIGVQTDVSTLTPRREIPGKSECRSKLSTN